MAAVKDLHDDIMNLHRQGYSIRAIAKELNCAKSTVQHHVERPAGIKPRCYNIGQERIDWEDVIAFWNRGHSLVECMNEFSFTRQAWYRYIKKHDLPLSAS